MLQAEWPENRCSSPDKVTAFSVPTATRLTVRANKGSYAMSTTDSFIGSKAAGP